MNKCLHCNQPTAHSGATFCAECLALLKLWRPSFYYALNDRDALKAAYAGAVSLNFLRTTKNKPTTKQTPKV